MTEHKLAIAKDTGAKIPFARRLTAAGFLLISTALIAAPMGASAQSYRFTNVKIQGNERIDPSAILNYAGIKRGEVISGAKLNDAYQEILASGLFESVQIDPRGNTLVIKVVERPTINVINFEGNARLKDKVLGAIVQSKSRQAFNPTLAERDAAAIVEAYAQQGRLAARVTPRIIRRSDNRVDLVFEIFEGGVVENERISFVGNKKYSDRRLRRVLQTKQAGFLRAVFKSDTFIEDRIQFDKQVLKDFYLSRGYVDFRVKNVNAELARERDGYFLSFNIYEGQQFTFGEITTVSEMDGVEAEEFQDALKLRPGVVYSPALVENSITRMERLALKKGLDFVRIEPRITRNDRDLSLDVEFVISKGPRVFVERIDIEGNTSTLDRVVRRQFDLAEGDAFNPRAIRQAAERIRALGFFGKSDVKAREGTRPDQVIVDVNVEEQPTGSLSFGGSYGSADGFGLLISYSEKNFMGRGQYLSFDLSTAAEAKKYGLTFREPAFLGRNLGFGLQMSYSEVDRTDARYSNNVGIFSPSITFPTGENSRLSLRYTAKRDDMVLGDTAVAGSLIDQEAARGALWSSSLGYSYAYDTRRSGLNPNAGILLEFSQDFGGIGGDYEFIKTTAKAVAQTKVFHEEVTLRASLEGGLLHSPGKDSRVGDRFMIGNRIMRGFEPLGLGPREINGTNDDALGGTKYAVARFEAEFPLGLPEEYGISGGIFYDIGSVWGLDSTAGAGTIHNDSKPRQVVGASIFWNTPIGPLRFNFSKALVKQDYDREQTFDLTIRTDF